MIKSLNQAEQQMAIHLALSRFANARNRGIFNGRVGDMPDWRIDLEGIGGEIFACKELNVYPDTETNLADLPKEDLVTKNGRTVDVKTTPLEYGKLLVKTSKKNKACDIYILVIGSFPEYRLAGWATQEEVFKDENIQNQGHKDNYTLTQSQLRKFGGDDENKKTKL